MTSSKEQSEQDPDKPNWPLRVGLAIIGLLVLAVLYLALAAFIPRWWALRVSNLSEQSFARGISWGLFFGVISTLLPLLLVLFAATRWRGTAGKFLGTTALVLAAIFAAPNLMTLAIVQGSSNAAHAGERIFDTEAPGFRAASLVGAILAALTFLMLLFFYFRYRKRGKEIRAQREAEEQRKQEEKERKQELKQRQREEKERQQARDGERPDPEVPASEVGAPPPEGMSTTDR